MTAPREFYPPGPSVPGHFAKPTAAYRRDAWIASTVLFSFVGLYVFLAGWFLLTAWRLGGSLLSGSSVFEPLLGAVCAAFMSVFLLKGLVFVKHHGDSADHEVTREQQPRLFAILDRLQRK